MINIRVDVQDTIKNGYELVFIAPCDCSEIDRLNVYYQNTQEQVVSQSFIFKDAHGSVLVDMDHLFKAGAYVKVILNVTDGIAYIQNSDTNSYLVAQFKDFVDYFQKYLCIR